MALASTSSKGIDDFYVVPREMIFYRTGCKLDHAIYAVVLLDLTWAINDADRGLTKLFNDVVMSLEMCGSLCSMLLIMTD